MEKKECRMHKNQEGMMVVEAVLSFTVFVMVVVAIVYLINIFIVHNKVQFAINSAAHEIAAYSYLYQALGIRGAEQTLDKDGNPYTQPIDDTANQLVDSFNAIQNLYTDAAETGNAIQDMEISSDSLKKVYDQIEKTAESGGEAIDSVEESVKDMANLFKDPKSFVAGMVYMGISAGSYAIKSAGAEIAAEVVTQKYIRDDGRNADAWLKAYGVAEGYAGLDFSGSTMFCDENRKLIDIVVQYDVDLKFVGLVLPEDTIHVVQRVTIPAWLDGDGITKD